MWFYIHEMFLLIVKQQELNSTTRWGYHVYLRHGTSVYKHIKTRLESGPVTVDLTINVVHSSKLLINDVKPVHSLTHCFTHSLHDTKAELYTY